MKEKSMLHSERLLSCVQIGLGSLMGALAYPLFLVPNHIAPGGLTGAATVLNVWFHWPVGTVSLLMNIPLFLCGFRSMGRRFGLRSLGATLLFSLLIDVLPLPPMTQDPLLGAVFGGVLLGAGLGFILRGGATTGGSDLAARMVHRRFQHISVGALLFGIDALVVALAGVSIQAEYALYAFISIYLSSRVVDMVMLGFSRDKACYIISEKHEEIKRGLMEDLNRGVTVLEATGGFSGEVRQMLLCVLSAQELGRLKAAVRSADERAFVFITDAHEVLGEGFRRLE